MQFQLNSAMMIYLNYVTLTLNIWIIVMKFCLVTTKAKPKVGDNLENTAASKGTILCTWQYNCSRAYN